MNEVVRKLHDYALCVRSRAVPIFAYTWAALIGILIASRGFPPLLPLLAVITIACCLGAAGYIFNDIMDFEIDRINNVGRPIAQEKVSKREAMGLVLVLTFGGLALGLLMNFQTFLLGTIFAVIAFLYSSPKIYLKRRFFIKQMSPSVNGAISNLIGGAVIGNMPPSLLYASFLFFAVAIAGSPIVDLADIKGDKERGAKTFVVVFGPSFTVKLGVTILLSFSIATFLVAPYVGLSIVAPVIITACVLFFSWVSFSLLRKYQDPEFCTTAYKRFALSLFIMQLATFVGVL